MRQDGADVGDSVKQKSAEEATERAGIRLARVRRGGASAETVCGDLERVRRRRAETRRQCRTASAGTHGADDVKRRQDVERDRERAFHDVRIEIDHRLGQRAAAGDFERVRRRGAETWNEREDGTRTESLRARASRRVTTGVGTQPDGSVCSDR